MESVLIDRRTLLLGGLATVAAACTSNKNDAANRAADEAATPIRVAPGETVSIGQIEAKPTVPKEKVPKSVVMVGDSITALSKTCLLYTSPSPRDGLLSRMPSSA